MSITSGIMTKITFKDFGLFEERISRQFSRVWYVTNAYREVHLSSEYFYIFVKPTDNLTRDFHLKDEILVLFSQYKNFEPRTLDFADKIISQYKHRLDKMVLIIISDDIEVKSIIRKREIQEKYSRIIIPFSYYEFGKTGNYEAMLTSRLREFLFSRDLFAFDTALRNDNFFFGRKDEILNLYSKYKAGENASVFGLRRIGKTSILLAVKRLLSSRNEPSSFIDCSETAFHCRRWYEALYFLIYSFVTAYDLQDEIELFAEEEYDEKNASICFEADLKKISSFYGGKRLLFILDEIESITFDLSPSEHWKTGMDFIFFWQSVRAIFQKNEDLFSYIIGGVNPKAVETAIVNNVDNPIYRAITPYYLGFFTVDEVKEMISTIGTYMGIQFDDEINTYLTDEFGGHPFLIRQVCSYLHQNSSQTNRPLRITKYHYNNQREKTQRYVRDYVDQIVTVLRERYKLEYELLEHLAQGEEDLFNEFARMSSEVTQHLEGYGLIRDDNGSYHFRISVVKDYIREHTNIAKILITQEDRWKEVSLRRNKLETNLRKVVKMTLKLNFGLSNGKTVFLSVISPPQRKAKLEILTLEEIFDAEIYFEDLRKIIQTNWDQFKIVFNNDKERFNSYMEQVNKNRIDAHARDVDDDTLAVLLIAIQWLEKQINAFLS